MKAKFHKHHNVVPQKYVEILYDGTQIFLKSELGSDSSQNSPGSAEQNSFAVHGQQK